MKWAGLFMSFILVANQLCAQFSEDNVWVSVFQEPTEEEVIESSEADTLLNPLSVVETDDYQYIVFVSISDASLLDDIAYIDVTLDADSSELSTNNFTFDASPSGDLTFDRDGGSIRLGMGHFSYYEDIEATVVIEDSSGNLSDPFIFSTEE